MVHPLASTGYILTSARGAQELSIRSALNQSRAFFSRDRNEVRIAKLEWQKARLQRVHVGHTSGRHAFCRECCHRPAEDTKEQEASRETINHLMWVRGSWYGCLPPHTHFHDDDMADTSSSAKWQGIEDGISGIDARMELMVERSEAEGSMIPRPYAGDHPLTDSEFEGFLHTHRVCQEQTCGYDIGNRAE